MNYKANALLKSSQQIESDNLYYEYLVGRMFINKVNKIFPCFTETYHLFEHESTKTKNKLRKKKLVLRELTNTVKINGCDESVIKNSLACIDNSLVCIDNSCLNGVYYSILLQYISNPIDVYSFMEKHENDELFEGQMLCILFQIYACLSYLKDHFTHYDLHTRNVLLYQLPVGNNTRYLRYLSCW